MQRRMTRATLSPSLLFVLFVSVSLAADSLLLTIAEAKRVDTSLVPAMFVFGDSGLDAGTNKYIPSLSQANFKPYGMQYFGKPTGRFTNGRTYADFIANYVGLPLVEPYLANKGKRSIVKGVNYASGGSGALRITNEEDGVISFPDQISQFSQTQQFIEETLKSKVAAKELFSKSLYLIGIGANDLANYVSAPSGSLEDLLNSLLVSLNDSIKVLYAAGARKVMIIDYGPVGCVPNVLATLNITDGKCVHPLNTVVQVFNAALEQFVIKLPQSYPDMKAIIGKTYSKFSEFVAPGNRYGFTAGSTACCGSGPYNGVGQCGRPADIITNTPTNLCDDVEKYVYWDLFHTTDKAHGLMAQEFWTGNTTYVAPINLRTLVSV